MKCDCPQAFRYHADNCPDQPSRVLNAALDKKCRVEEAAFASARAGDWRPLAAFVRGLSFGVLGAEQ